MTKKNYTAIVLVVDRSGSMKSIAKATEDALAEFLNGQKAQPGTLTVDTVFFDDTYEERAHFANPKRKKLDLTINPRGMTALFDAVGKKINSFGEELANLPEEKRPSSVLFVIATDGLENASREYTSGVLAEMIKHQQEKYSWGFTFIGANQDAVLTAEAMNISRDHAITFNASAAGVTNVIGSLDAYTTSYRSGVAAAFKDSDREAALEN